MTQTTPTRDEAPERIRVAQDADGFWTCREAISGSQEYVRADLASAPAPASGGVDAVAVAKECAQWLEVIMEATGWQEPEGEKYIAASIAKAASLSPAATPVSEAWVESLPVVGMLYVARGGATARVVSGLENGADEYSELVRLADVRALAKPASSPAGALDYVRLGARAMRRMAQASCGNHSEGALEDAMTSTGLSKEDKTKLYAEADAADHISKDIRETVEDSALGYASYMGDDEDRKALAALGVTSNWLYRRENGQPSRPEIAALSQSTSAGRVGE